jgi:hypothetical protein
MSGLHTLGSVMVISKSTTMTVQRTQSYSSDRCLCLQYVFRCRVLCFVKPIMHTYIEYEMGLESRHVG